MVKLSLCRISNQDIANCGGFDLSIHKGHFHLNAHCHSKEKSVYIESLSFSMSFTFPTWFSIRLFNKDTEVIRISPTSLQRLLERIF